MLKFARWLVPALFVSSVVALLAGDLLSAVARRHEQERNPQAHSVHYESVEEQAFWRVFTWTAVTVFVVLIFASRIKLPESTRTIAMGALAGVAIAVVGGHVASTLRDEPGFHMKRERPSITLALRIGVPALGVMGGISGYLWHRRRQKQSEVDRTDITSHTSADTTAP